MLKDEKRNLPNGCVKRSNFSIEAIMNGGGRDRKRPHEEATSGVGEPVEKVKRAAAETEQRELSPGWGGAEPAGKGTSMTGLLEQYIMQQLTWNSLAAKASEGGTGVAERTAFGAATGAAKAQLEHLLLLNGLDSAGLTAGAAHLGSVSPLNALPPRPAASTPAAFGAFVPNAAAVPLPGSQPPMLDIGANLSLLNQMPHFTGPYPLWNDIMMQQIAMSERSCYPAAHSFPMTMTTNPFSVPYHMRKPKRIRTAFSPSQLLELEEAFEKNHYVVGQERKDLASSLNLSETQVKVWFQNRRTKHKRVKTDGDTADDHSDAHSVDDSDSESVHELNATAL